MAGNSPDVAIRLGLVGENEVETGLQAVGETGDKATLRLVKGFESASAAADAAAAKAQAAGQRVVAALSLTNTANNQPVSAGPQQNAMMLAYNAYMAQQAREAEALRNAIEPLRVSQAAYDREIEVARGLLASGSISQEEYAASVRLSNQSLAEAKERLSGANEAGGHYSMGQVVLQSALRKTADQFAAGAPASTIFAEHVGTLVEVLQLYSQTTAKKTEEASDGVGEGIKGAGEKAVEGAEKFTHFGGAIGAVAGFLAGPWGIAVTAGVSLLSAFLPKLLETNDAADKAAAEGLKSFEDRQKEMARFIDATTGKIDQQHRALVALNAVQYPAAIQGKASETQGYTNQAFKAARDAVSSMGTSRNNAAKNLLGEAISEAGSNSATLAKNIDGLVARFPQLAGLANTVGDFASKAAQGAIDIRQMQGAQAEWNAKVSGAIPLTVDLAKRNVDRALATDAVSKAQQRLSEMEAEGAELKDRPYSAGQQAEIAAWQTKMIAARQAVESAQQAERDAAAATREHSKEMREAAKEAERYAKLVTDMWTSLARLSSELGKREIGGIAESDKKDREERDKLADERVKPGNWLVDQDFQQQAALEYARKEADTVGMTALQRQIALDTLKKTNEFLEHDVDLNSDSAKAVLAGVAAMDRMQETARRAGAAMQDIRDFGGQLVDKLADGSLKAQDLLQWMEKIAILNPIKNLLGGEHQTTIGDIFGSVTKLFGSKGGGSTTFTDDGQIIPAGHNAGGTNYWQGGLTWVGENGRELINLPRGSSVTPAAQTRQMLAANDRGGDTHNHYYIEGNLLTPEFWSQIQAGDDGAAVRGAYGGAQLAGTQGARRRERTMR